MFLLQINSEFVRITTLPLQPRFLAFLDRQSSQLLRLLGAKVEPSVKKTKDTIKVIDQVFVAFE